MHFEFKFSHCKSSFKKHTIMFNMLKINKNLFQFQLILNFNNYYIIINFQKNHVYIQANRVYVS